MGTRAPFAGVDEVDLRCLRGIDAMTDAVQGWLASAVRSRGRFVGLAVGDSTLPLYGRMPWDAAWEGKQIVPIDELVPPPHRGENAFSARLRAALPTEFAGILKPIRVGRDPAVAARALERGLLRHGLCAAVLGLGPDGHVAFNQPGSEADTITRVVDLRSENAGRLRDVSPATGAVTMGVATLMRSKHVALVVSGSGKVEALRRVLEGPEGADMPATYLRRHRSLTVFADACA